MKSPFLAKALVISAALAISLTPGCRRKTKEPITHLPAARSGPSIQNPNAGSPTLPGGGRTNPTDRGMGMNNPDGTQGTELAGNNGAVQSPPPSQNTNVALGEGGQLDRSQYAEDRSHFSANTVLFDFDSSVVKTSEKAKLAAVADHLKSTPRTSIEVEGHCDERGTEEYNRSLGERRALAVREEIALLGVDPKRVYTISLGEDRPAVSGHDENAWGRNRRSEIILLTPRQ